MDKYDEIIGKCPHCGRNLTSDHVCPKLASMTMSTHWEGCWEEHHACAVAAIRELKEELARVKAPVSEGEIAEVVSRLNEYIALEDEAIKHGVYGYPSIGGEHDRQTLRAIESLAAKVGELDRAWKAQQFHLEAEERESDFQRERAERAEAERDAMRVCLDAPYNEDKRRRFHAEAELAKLKAHAEAMANAIENDETGPGIWATAAAYRADFPKE